MGQSKLEMVRQALAELGEVSDADLLTFLERTHGVRLDTKYLPVVRASLRGLENLEQARLAARAAEKAMAEEQVTRRRRPGVESRPGRAGPSEPPAEELG